MNRLALAASLASAAVGISSCAGTPQDGRGEAPLPPEVIAAVDGLIADCEPEPGEPSVTPEARQASLASVGVYDLNGDEYPDYLIDDSRVACSAGVSRSARGSRSVRASPTASGCCSEAPTAVRTRRVSRAPR